MVDLIVERKTSKKGNDYFCLSVDFGYRKQVLTYDTAIICAVCKISEEILYNSIKLDEPFKIGVLDITFDKE